MPCLVLENSFRPSLPYSLGFPGSSALKNPLANAEDGGDAARCRIDPSVGKIPWRRKWKPTPVFLLGESHGQRILVGYSPWGHKELDTTKHAR